MINTSYGWGVNYGDTHLEMNQGQEIKYSVRLVNVDDKDVMIAFDINDPDNLVQAVNRESPVLVPAGTRGFPDPNRIEVITTIKLDENATEPYYYVTLTFGDVVGDGTGIGMRLSQSIRLTINNTMIPEFVVEKLEEYEDVEYTYSQDVLVLSFILASLFLVLSLETLKDYHKKKKDEEEKKKKKTKKLKKEILKSIILLLLVFVLAFPLTLVSASSTADETIAVVTIGERDASLTISQIDSVIVGDEVLFYAYYRNEDNKLIKGANCVLEIDGNSYTMDEKLSRYEKSLKFNTVGKYNYKISCGEDYYESKSQTSSFEVSSRGGITRPSPPPPPVEEDLVDYIHESFEMEDFKEIEIIIYLIKDVQDPRIVCTDDCLDYTKEGYVFYSCFTIEPLYDKELTKNMTIIFGIKKEWFRDEDINISTVVLEKEGTLSKTEVLDEEDENFIFFMSTFDSFSVFRVYARRNVYPKVDYWDMLREIEDYYYRPRHISDVEDILKLYYGKFEGTGVTTVYEFDEHLLDTDRIVALLLLSLLVILVVSKKRRDKNDKK